MTALQPHSGQQPQAMATVQAAPMVQHNPGELATTSAAARAQAEIQAQYAIAMAKPRNMDGVRTRILDHCRRFEFADAAIYKLPRGNKKVTGLGVRFAEELRRAMTNMRSTRRTIFENDELLVLEVSVTDLEANTSESREVSVEKRLERKQLRRSRNGTPEPYLLERLNSYGDTIYVVRASRPELRDVIGSECARAERECSLKLAPADLKAECEKVCMQAIRDGAKGDEGKTRRNDLVDAFAKMGITPEELTAYLKHPLSQMTEDDFADLRMVYRAISTEGHSWRDFADKAGLEDEAAAKEAPAPDQKTQSTKELLNKRRKTKKPYEKPALKEEPQPEPQPEPELDFDALAQQHAAQAREEGLKE